MILELLIAINQIPKLLGSSSGNTLNEEEHKTSIPLIEETEEYSNHFQLECNSTDILSVEVIFEEVHTAFEAVTFTVSPSSSTEEEPVERPRDSVMNEEETEKTEETVLESMEVRETQKVRGRHSPSNDSAFEDGEFSHEGDEESVSGISERSVFTDSGYSNTNGMKRNIRSVDDLRLKHRTGIRSMYVRKDRMEERSRLALEQHIGRIRKARKQPISSLPHTAQSISTRSFRGINQYNTSLSTTVSMYGGNRTYGSCNGQL